MAQRGTRTLSRTPKFRNFLWRASYQSRSRLASTPDRRMRTSSIASSLLLLGLALPTAAQQSSTASLYGQAVNDWARGAYPSAMQKLTAVLSASDGDSYLERTALLTGELFRTTEISTDGRTVPWSPSGNFAS